MGYDDYRHSYDGDLDAAIADNIIDLTARRDHDGRHVIAAVDPASDEHHLVTATILDGVYHVHVHPSVDHIVVHADHVDRVTVHNATAVDASGAAKDG
jgi:hypothetical protein